MTQKAFFTGGIVTYNNADTIVGCIRSILEHTKDPSFKLYVYDNASTDGTPDLIRQQFPEVILICGSENLGFGQGHNQILKQTNADYHAIINPDIYLKDDVLDKMAACMAAHKKVVQMTVQVCNLDGTIQHLPLRDPNFRYVILSKFPPFKHYRDEYTRADESLSGRTRVDSATGCFSMVRTTAFHTIGGYDPRFFLYFEDADLSRRLRQEGIILFDPALSVTHAWKRDNTGSLKGIVTFLKSMINYKRKWLWR